MVKYLWNGRRVNPIEWKGMDNDARKYVSNLMIY